MIKRCAKVHEAGSILTSSATVVGLAVAVHALLTQPSLVMGLRGGDAAAGLVLFCRAAHRSALRSSAVTSAAVCPTWEEPRVVVVLVCISSGCSRTADISLQ
jgi:hypothetical protein